MYLPESYRDEHCHKYAGTRNDRHGNIAHGIFSRLIGRLIADVEFRLYRFYYDDRIIHHRTNSQYQRKKSQDVDTNPAATKQAKVPTNETMIEIEGINVLLKSCKKK